MENHYYVKLDRNGVVAEVKRDLDLHYTISNEKLYRTEYYTGVFEGKNYEDVIEKAKQAYLSYKSPS